MMLFQRPCFENQCLAGSPLSKLRMFLCSCCICLRSLSGSHAAELENSGEATILSRILGLHFSPVESSWAGGLLQQGLHKRAGWSPGVWNIRASGVKKEAFKTCSGYFP